METPNTRSWSDLPLDLLESIFKRLSYTDFHRAKIVCSNWNSSSKLTAPQKIRSPCLMLYSEGDDDCCVHLYNPEEDKIYRTKRDFSRIRILGNWGNWFLVIDSRSNLYIIDVFSENTINLPPLESLQTSENCTLKQLGDKIFRGVITTDHVIMDTDALKGVLWVDEKTQDYIVLWFTVSNVSCVFFCKKGDDHYTYIPLLPGVSRSLQYIYDVILRGHILYIISDHYFIRFIDLSGPQGFRDVRWRRSFDIPYSYYNRADRRMFAFNTSGDALLVQSILDKTTVKRHMTFRVFKKDPDQNGYGIEVGSLGDESLILGSRIFVPDIEPNSIYITSHDRPGLQKSLQTDICVYNLATKTFKGFPNLSNMKFRNSRWFLPGV